MLSGIKKALGTSILERVGSVSGGCISGAEVYRTDQGKVFVKKNSDETARQMFDGEFESLKAIQRTGTVRTPTPLVIVDSKECGETAIVMEYLEDMHGLNKKAGQLGTNLAKLHLHNIEAKDPARQSRVGDDSSTTYVEQFGFSCNTYSGSIPHDNTWTDDWLEFYTRKLDYQISLIQENYGDRQASELWSHLQLKIPQFFSDIEVLPSLLHGDLWSGNIGEVSNEPVIFDPVSFYGHHEYDLAIFDLCGGFSDSFWHEYHTLIPKQSGWNNRHKLYRLFYDLNHWNLFGNGYKIEGLNLMRELCNE